MFVLIDEYGLCITDKHVFFFKNKCPFSNFYVAPFKYPACKDKNVIFHTSEQFFMWSKAMKFADSETALKILSAKTPKECKELGRKVKNYDDKVWDDVRFDVMFDANFLKFSQNEDLKKFLLDERFDGKTFVEASPYDPIWGIQMAIGDPCLNDESLWQGLNLQGKVIDKVRMMLKKA